MITTDSAEDLVRRVRRGRVGLRPRLAWLFLLALVVGVIVAGPSGLAGAPGALILLPQFLLVGLVLWMWSRARRHQRAAARLTRLWEAVQLKDWAVAESLARELLTGVPVGPPARANALLALSAVADGQKQYDAAQHVLEAILQDRTTDPGQRYAARVGLAGAMLRNGQLTDGIDLIEQLSRNELPPPLRAQIELLNLFRSVTMGQVDTAVSRADERRELFRAHLGTRAGYGYALLAAAFDRAGDPARAADFWRDATTLVRPEECVDRFEDTRDVSRKYPATEWPL
jgi:hypothetical protein